MIASVAIMVLSIVATGVEQRDQLRFLPSEAGWAFWPLAAKSALVSVSYADGGVMSLPHFSHDPSTRFPSRDAGRGGMMNVQIAQGGRDSRDDGAAARSDALMGTPNKKTPVPQTNTFSTSPRLEQQPPATEPPAPRGATPAPSAPPR